MLIDRQMLRVLIEADSDRLRKLQLNRQRSWAGFPGGHRGRSAPRSEAGYRGFALKVSNG